MTKVVDLHHYRTKVVEQRAFGPWQKRFGETYDANTCLTDLTDATKFNYLASEQQMRVVDIHLFLADQMRFEMMRRLEWLETLPCQNFTMISMVQTYEQVRNRFKDNPPGLAPSHPGHEAYQKLAIRDKEVFIRQMLREALEEFQNRIES
jgi:hypothetical protein